jgi:hypothetical protein
VVKVARPAEDAGPDVVVEVSNESADRESSFQNRLLDVEPSLGSAGSEREEHVSTATDERLGSARQEQTRGGERVRRVGHNRVEGAPEWCRERLAEIPFEAPHRKRRAVQLLAHEREDRRIEIEDRDFRHRRV